MRRIVGARNKERGNERRKGRGATCDVQKTKWKTGVLRTLQLHRGPWHQFSPVRHTGGVCQVNQYYCACIFHLTSFISVFVCSFEPPRCVCMFSNTSGLSLALPAYESSLALPSTRPTGGHSFHAFRFLSHSSSLVTVIQLAQSTASGLDRTMSRIVVQIKMKFCTDSLYSHRIHPTAFVSTVYIYLLDLLPLSLVQTFL